MKYIKVCSIVLLLVIACQQLRAQCPSGAVMLDSLTSIQNNMLTSVPAKIKSLTALRQVFLNCSKRKDSVYARIVHRLGDLYGKVNDLEKAIAFTKDAIAVNRLDNAWAEKSFLANSYMNLGIFYKASYLQDESNNCFDSCIFISRQFPEKYFITFKAFDAKAFSFVQKGDYQKGLETAENGLLFAERIKDTINEAPLLAQKAQAELALKQVDIAERDITRSIFILESKTTDTLRLATSYSIYASLLSKKGNPKSAIGFYQKAFNLNRAVANWNQCSRDLSDLGLLYDAQLQNDTRALACYAEAVKMVEKSRDAYQLAAIYINMGVVNWRKKDFQQALQLYQKALNVLPIRFRDTSIKTNPTAGMLKLVANDYFISTLLSNKGEALLDLYRVEKKEELLSAALSSFEAADKSVDLMRWKQYGEQSKLFWREKTKSMYGNAVEVCYLLNNVQRAFYFFEKSRALLLNDKLSELGAKKFLSPTDNIKEQHLRIRISSFNNRLSQLPEGHPEYNTTRRQFLSAQEEWEKFIRGLEARYPVYYQYKYENATYPLLAVKNQLSSNNQTLVEFFNSDSVVYVLLVSAQKDRLLRIPYADYGVQAKAFMTLCSGRLVLKSDYTAYRTLAFKLYEKLVKPLDLPAGRIIISPDDYLIPFEALISDKAVPSSFLLKRYALSYTYSMGLLMKKSHHLSESGNSFLGVAPVNYQPYLHLEPLTGADESLRNIRPYFGNASFLVNEKATKQQFLQRLSQYRTVQVYSHADADSSGREPRLFLGDSALHINEIEPLEDLQTEMIILSACKTAVGRNARGEGVFSLARAFLSLGIPSTVTTLWQVDNEATYRLTEGFYKYLSLGLPKDIALQKAKLELIESDEETYRMPYFWAGNIMLGKSNAIRRDDAGINLKVIILLIAGASILVLSWFAAVKKFGLRPSGKS